MKKLLMAIMLITVSAFTQAGTTDEPKTVSGSRDLIVAVNKTIMKSQVESALSDLENYDLTMGPCYFNAKLDEYVDYSFSTEASYYGVAIVNLDYQCTSQNKIDSYLEQINKDHRFQIFSNPQIGAHESAIVIN